MKEFDYIILGGGCAGLSLAYELDINKKLKEKTLAIVETRDEYKRDKTWSFWKVTDHNFDDCVIKSWSNFSINSELGSHEVVNKEYPYQTIDSGFFYRKIGRNIKQKRNMKNYEKSGKIYVNNFGKIYQTILSLFDLMFLYLKDVESHQRTREHEIIREEINLDERI